MLRYLILSYLVALSSVSCGNSLTNEVIDDQELVFALVVNRHGERSPDADELSLSDQQELILNLTYIEGPEGLTNVGKRRAYQIGKFYRQRYGSQGHKLISNIYRHDDIAIRSTEKERTKMTIQVAMAAAYPPEPEQQWDEGLGKVWQPVPYSAVPIAEDYLRYYSNCKRFKTLMAEAQANSMSDEFLPFLDLIPLIKNKTGEDFTGRPIWFETLYDLFRSTIGLGLHLPEWAKPILGRLGEAGRLAYRLYFRTDEMKKIGGGVLLDKFVTAGNDFIAGKQVSQRLRLFSAHDFNIGALMEVAKVENDHSIPEYGAVFALELYRSRSTGAYSVLPMYLPKAGESSAQYLRIKGCGNSSHCNFNTFRELTKEFLLPEKEFYTKCDIKTEL
ncbi:venom acid phosphatase Acph-1 isoform X1 [Spodoptera frugiperda]|uniref:acid phosphatase n=1 Tax=Spodoptera frugiperda TaxID=7108 RepID=A0A9R0D7R5_SPOFR|nr:venom acid phosphatase Acph-1 isoform X1 [Spodoptera frugiperda]XP_035443470.1 venom acid phosphatase Acph-1 isoform X1 [Spodoptera frugiperda]